MKTQMGFRSARETRTRNCRAAGAIAALAALVAALGGCNRDEVVRAFRAGASDQLQAGVESIALGVINGTFSAFDLGSGDSGSANTSGATTPSTTDSTTTGTP
jgi:urease accessory protein UreF